MLTFGGLKSSHHKSLFKGLIRNDVSDTSTVITVVYIGGLTPVKIFLRLRLQNLFPGVCPPMVA